MALLMFGSSRCAICGGILEDKLNVVATSHFITDRSDPLYHYSDVGMHSECFVAWPLRSEFTARYNAVQRPAPATGLQKRMEPDGQIVWQQPIERIPPAT